MKQKLTLAITTLLSTAQILAHEHLAAGAASTAPGSPLIFVNAGDFEANSGFVFSLQEGDAASPYNGWFLTSDLTFEALAATADNGGPEPQAAAPGSHIEVVVQSVEGPAGAHFAFWETPQDGTSGTNLTWSLPTGSTNGTNHIVISENDGSAGSDPYGHIHGRVYSVDQPGFYRVGFQFVDTSRNNQSGPIHSPSARFHLYFQAGISVAKLELTTDGAQVSFAAPSNVDDEDPTGTPMNYQLEASLTLGPSAKWQPVIDPITGDDHLHVLTLPTGAAAGFFRLRGDGPR